MSYFRNLARAMRFMGTAMMGSTGYEGASTGRRLTAWAETDSAISALLSFEGDVLRRRCRGLVRKNHWARCSQESYVANAIGTGIKPESLHPDPAVRNLIHGTWRDSVMEMDADGVTDFYGLQQLAMREIFQAGETLVRFRPRRPEDGLIVPLQLQVIPSEHLPFTDNRPNGQNVIRSGIEFTPFGKRAAYHIYREHPGLGTFALSTRANEQVRVPAENVLHLFQRIASGQYRGEPWLVPVMVTLYELDQFVDAVLVRQKLGNMFLGWQRRSNLDDSGPMLATRTAPGSSPAEAGVGFGIVQPGTMLDLADGDTLEFNDPPGPGAQFGEFLKVMLHAFASGIGVPYEQITWDLESVNYSSIRAGLLEFRRRCEQFQFQVMSFQFCRPVWRRWINDAALAGVLPQPRDPQGWRDLYSVEWRTPAWDWVDPLKDVLAKKEEVRCGFTSRSAVVHERGYDPEQVDAEVRADNARADTEPPLIYDSDPRKTAASGIAQQMVAAEQGERR